MAAALAGCGIGGGSSESSVIRGSDGSSTTAKTSEELVSALESASAGDVVSVPPDTTIDLSGVWEVRIPRGVTLAGDRGLALSDRALLEDTASYDGPSYNKTPKKIHVDNGARMTGFRVRGPTREYVGPGSAGGETPNLGGGVRVRGGELDNCELSGWARAAVSTFEGAHVHDNRIHQNVREGFGYGVEVFEGTAVVEHNAFDANRRAIFVASDGPPMLVARQNVVGPDLYGVPIEVAGAEGVAGESIVLHRNTIEGTETSAEKTANPGASVPAVRIGGTPVEGAWVDGNWFYHGSRKAAYEQSGGPKRATFGDNHYGESEPSSDGVGAARSGGGLL